MIRHQRPLYVDFDNVFIGSNDSTATSLLVYRNFVDQFFRTNQQTDTLKKNKLLLDELRFRANNNTLSLATFAHIIDQLDTQ